jgi:hypothetical protein
VSWLDARWELLFVKISGGSPVAGEVGALLHWVAGQQSKWAVRSLFLLSLSHYVIRHLPKYPSGV